MPEELRLREGQRTQGRLATLTALVEEHAVPHAEGQDFRLHREGADVSLPEHRIAAMPDERQSGCHIERAQALGQDSALRRPTHHEDTVPLARVRQAKLVAGLQARQPVRRHRNLGLSGVRGDEEHPRGRKGLAAPVLVPGNVQHALLELTDLGSQLRTAQIDEHATRLAVCRPRAP